MDLMVKLLDGLRMFEGFVYEELVWRGFEDFMIRLLV